MEKDNKGYIYIMSNPEFDSKVKIGKSSKIPHIRAEQLTKQTATIGEFIVEWYMEVPDYDIAETIAHYKLKEFNFQKEYFKITILEASKILENTFCEFFKIEQPIIFKGEKITEHNQTFKLKEDLLHKHSNTDNKEKIFVTIQENLFNELLEYFVNNIQEKGQSDIEKIKCLESAIRGAESVLKDMREKNNLEKIEQIEKKIRGAELAIKLLKSRNK
ncbi:MAG: GIY-YIG nuclease family protein [Bacteroidetes bacterium]|nr:MAG: GIY-YIG nuclease family protein [Bacteroidota bacterium]